jgi:hypothetical protein
MRLDLTESDMQAIAATWGTQFRELLLSDCTLTATTWTALNAAAVPALHYLHVTLLSSWESMADLAGFCLEWPADRKLEIKLMDSETAVAMAARLREMLVARGRTNLTILFL